jgi:hypothetical protein
LQGRSPRHCTETGCANLEDGEKDMGLYRCSHFKEEVARVRSLLVMGGIDGR